MLDTVYRTIAKNDVLFVNAPTGIEKSSLISPILAQAGNRKVVIAVRTTSQLKIFQNELEKIREKKPDLTYSYLIGRVIRSEKDKGILILGDKKYASNNAKMKNLPEWILKEMKVCSSSNVLNKIKKKRSMKELI